MKRFLSTALGFLGCLSASISAADDVPLPKPLFEINGAFEDAVIRSGHLILSAQEAEMGDPDLQVYKLNGAEKPKRVGEYHSIGNAHSVALKDSYLVIANGDLGIDIVDLTNPKQPLEVASIKLDGYNQKVALNGNHAYVASGFHGIHVIDISDPHQPKPISTYQAYAPPQKTMFTEEEAEDLFSSSGEQDNSMTYNMAENQDFYDADDQPAYEDAEVEVNLKEIERKDGAMDIALNGSVAFIAYGSAGIISVDISNPKKITKLQELRLDWPVERLLLKGGQIHAITGIGGIQVIDISRPEKMTPLGAYRTFCYPQDIAQANDVVFIADGYCGGHGLIKASFNANHNAELSPVVSGDVGSVATSGGMVFSMGPNKAQAFGFQ